MEIERRKFQGVLNILSFNRHFYVFGLIALSLLIGSHFVFPWPKALLYLVIFAFAYGLFMPLVISAHVYDFSGFYNFDWLRNLNLEDGPQHLNLNINAGFDETSFLIKNILPRSELQVYDFYDAERHTEPAIVRARKVSLVYPNTQEINSGEIPLQDNSVDNVFLISAIHEIRRHEEKVQFLRECKRVCKADGNIIMVEHLRDFPNFLAFTVGFTHFFSSATWKKAYKEAGFETIKESKFTAFMSIFICK
ncbi:MAG: methyltransferase domain-containing protein [Bacteroidota bacterium]